MNRIAVRSPLFDTIYVDVDLYWTRTRELTVVVDDSNHDRLMSLMGNATRVEFVVDIHGDYVVFVFSDMVCHKRSIAGKNIVTFLEDSDL